MTIERATQRRLPHLPVRGIVAALLLWFGGVAAIAAVADPPEVVVFGPQGVALAAAEQAGTPLLSAGWGFVTVRAEHSGTVRSLYAAGAWFVWPVFRTGCLG